MTSATIDPSLYCLFEDDKLVGIDGSYVDDLLRAGTNEWKTHWDATVERIQITEIKQEQLTFIGMRITESENMYQIDQNVFMSKMEQIPSDVRFSKFVSWERNSHG